MNDETTNKKLLHGACIHVLHTVKLHVTLEYGAHGLAKFLLIAIACRTDWLLRLLTIYTKYSIDKSADEVILQRHIAL